MISRLFLSMIIVLSAMQSSTANTRVKYKHLGDDFFTIEKSTKKALVLFSDTKVKKNYLTLNLSDYVGDSLYLTFIATEGLCLFSNGELVFKSSIADTVNLPLNTLNSSGQCLLTFYSPSKEFNHNFVHLSKFSSRNEEGGVNWILRKGLYKSETTVFLILIALLLALIKIKDTSLWSSYFEVTKFLNRNSNSEDFILRSVFSLESILILCFSSLLGTFLLSEWGLNLVLKDGGSAITRSILHFLILYAFFLSKYFFLKGATWFLGFSKFNLEQFFEFVRFIIWFFIALLFLVLLFDTEAKTVSKISLLLGVTFWNIRILITAISKLKFQKLYLFSYICASELIPAIVLINIIEQGN